MRFLSRLCLAIALLCPLLVPHGALAGVLPSGPNAQVTDPELRSEDGTDPSLAISGTTLYAAWLDTRFTKSSIYHEIFFARSEDGGMTWSANKDVSSDRYDGYADAYIHQPSISVAPNGDIYIVWGLESCNYPRPDTACDGGGLANDVRLARSTDGGATFAEYRVFDGLDSFDDVEQAPQVIAANDRAYVLYGSITAAGDGFDIYLRTVTPSAGGLSAAAPVKISAGVGNGRDSSSSGLSQFPRITMAVAGDRVCAAWEDRRSGGAGGRFWIYGACSADRGQTFGPNVPITGDDDYMPKLAFAPSGALCLAYQDAPQRDVLIRASPDGGGSWGGPLQATSIDSGLKIFDFALATDANGQLLLAAPLNEYRESDLYLYSSIDGGRSFAAYGPVQDGQGTYPTVAT